MVEEEKATNTTKEPVFSIPLGHPLPFDEHACSVSLPTWCSVVGYEEGNPDVTSKMGCGYPRFVYHPYVLKLMDVALHLDAGGKIGEISKDYNDLENRDCIVLPGKFCANRARDFMIRALDMERTIPLSSPDNALDIDIDMDKESNVRHPIRILRLPTKTAEVYALIFPAMTNAAIQAKSYWQHTGEVVSSRRAEIALMELGVNMKEIQRVTPDCMDHYIADGNGTYNNVKDLEGLRQCPTTNRTYACLYTSSDHTDSIHTSHGVKDEIKSRISSIVSQSPSSVFLAPSGMAAIYQALRSARRKRLNDASMKKAGGTAIVYGFPYLDTLKMCGRPELVPDGVEFFGNGDETDLKQLEKMLEARASSNKDGDTGIAALITEFPSNPLLNCHDLAALRKLADQYNFALIVDDTISCFANVDLLSTGIADAICTSLTKLFNGRGDSMAGSLVINEKTRMGQWMQQDLNQHYLNNGEENTLFPSDMTAMNANSKDFLERSHIINQTAEELADWFSTHPDVQEIYYPKYSQPDLYNRFLKDPMGKQHTAGYGGLLAIILGSHICQRTFYDMLPSSKGPSLGTNFTLICPYTLLAHYHELEFARTYNVSPNLIRIAVGLEDIHELKSAFEYAFDKGRLHPKLKPLESESHAASGSGGDLKRQSRGYCSTSMTCRPLMSWRRGNSIMSGVRSRHSIRSSMVGPVTLRPSHKLHYSTLALSRRAGTSSGGRLGLMVGRCIWNGLVQSQPCAGLR